MAIVHRTTLQPGKLELLTEWLPGQPWYLGTADAAPELTKVGGFRLDDPDGEVGIELMAVTDGSGGRPVTYLVPFSYRGAPLDGAEHALIGTMEHGVLGHRWAYDGAHDPVAVAQLLALVLGEAEPQEQSKSDTPDPSVSGWCVESGRPAAIASVGVTTGASGTDVLVRTVAGPGEEDPFGGQLTIHVNRVLTPLAPGSPAGAGPVLGHVTAGWQLPDGATARGRYVVVRDSPSGSAPDCVH